MLSSLTPKPLWQIFSQICAIPHPSHHEQRITQFVVDFAKAHHIDCELDQAGNILLRKAATPGMEQASSIALQAHLDMVPQKNEETQHDFLVDPIQAYVDGEWVKAKGTTLGADNGIGLASALAILIDQTIEHGPLEVLLTTSEETGMVGAFGLKSGWLKSRYLINTDSEAEGEIFTGCAGGVDFKQFLPIGYANIPEHHDICVHLALKGLKGGHSGCDIHLGRGNATKLLVRFLVEFVDDMDFRIADFSGGSLRNAIPREAFITLTLRQTDYTTLQSLMQDYSAILRNEYQQTEPNLVFTQQLLDKTQVKRVISHDHQRQIIDWLQTAPNGVVRMSNQISGVVETSLNLGVVEIKDNRVSAYYLIRSQVDSAKDAVVSTLISHSQLAGLQYELSGGYPGWQPDPNSALLRLTKHKYQELFSAKAQVMVIHAGLECGLFKTPYPEMDMVSIGPTIVSPHSPDEKVNISSVARYWNLLVATLKAADQLK
ncbi:aminoacyl-histidine dipeptidase [Utexia brackfieldae]|uniref:aminoacyl-histidine dipeptidase n=1 Tax=Utexia brackfieldae TaxID=3074108 RepID=UPI00370D6FF3